MGVLSKIAGLFRKKPRVVYKSAVDGRIVSEAFAKANPLTTYKLTMKPKA